MQPGTRPRQRQTDPPRYRPGERVAVLLPLPLSTASGGAYDYRVPSGEALADGDFVAVPLGRRQAVGVVWGKGEGGVAEAKLKNVVGRLDCPPLDATARAFIDWVAQYTLNPRGAVLKMAMSVPDSLTPPKPVAAYALNPDAPALRMTKARERVIAVLKDGPPRPAAELAREAGVGTGVVKGLADAGALITVALPARAAGPEPDWRLPGPALSPGQRDAARLLQKMVADGGFSVTVLEGVPGSGKTEVYFEAVVEALKAGGQVLVLLPEIALGAQWLARFRARFGAQPGEWHSELSAGQRRHTWRAVAEGRIKAVVGARSALYLPFRDLGLIVVDEEHDASFKQEDGAVYNARDMAVVRARLGGIPIVLASATPSLETVAPASPLPVSPDTPVAGGPASAPAATPDLPSHLAAAVPTPSVGVPTAAPDLPDVATPAAGHAAKHVPPAIAVTDFALQLLSPQGAQGAAAGAGAPANAPPAASSGPDRLMPTVDLGSPHLVAPMGVPSGDSSLLAVLAGYVLPGGGAPASTLVLFIVVGLILGIGLAGAPRGFERLALSRLLGASDGHSLAVPRPG